jgi:hypothetical protein
MACGKQGWMHSHLIPMKTRIAALILAAGISTTGVFADDSPSTSAAEPAAIISPAPVSDQFAGTRHFPDAAELYSVGAAQRLPASQSAPPENDARILRHAGDGLAIAFSYHVQAHPDAGSFLIEAPAPALVYSMPPSPAFEYDANYRALWFPSVSIRFDFGRHHRS